MQQLIDVLVADDLLLALAYNIASLPFETRKDVQIMFGALLRYKPANAQNSDPLVVTYVCQQRPEVVLALCEGYNQRESAQNCGTILREALRFEDVAKIVLCSEPCDIAAGQRALPASKLDPTKPDSGQSMFWKFFNWIDKGMFEVSADAFATFRVCYVIHIGSPSSELLTFSYRSSSPVTRNFAPAS